MCKFCILKSPPCTSLLEDLRINANSKIRNIISKDLNNRKLRTINCKDNIIDGLDSLIKGKLSSNRNMTEQSLTPWKSTILEEDYQKFSNLKTRIKPSKSNLI